MKYTSYTVQKGDSFWTIVRKLGCTMSELERLNNKLILLRVNLSKDRGMKFKEMHIKKHRQYQALKSNWLKISRYRLEGKEEHNAKVKR